MDADSPPAGGVTEAARDQAGQLKETSADAARQVAGTVMDKASDVTSDLGQQTRRLAGETRDQLVEQASRQKERAVQSLRSVGDELRGMAEHGQSGLGAQLAQQGAGFTDRAADYLQKHEPGDVLDEVRGFARRKPGMFLLAAAAAGLVAGRLTRALASSNTTTEGRPSADAVTDDYLVPPPAAPMRAAPLPATSAPPPEPTPVVPDPDPGMPVTPRFGTGTGQ
jgi:hypothetical protein